MAVAQHPDTGTLATMLARAFYDDPLFRYFFPDDAKRLNLSWYTCRYLVVSSHNKGQVVTNQSLTGAALWLPSGRAGNTPLDLLRFGAVKALLHQGPGALRRQLNAVEDMYAMQKAIICDPHYSLPLFGVDPDYQGKGEGSAILRPTLERFDKEGMPAYLDTHNPDNVSLYRRFGFEVVHHGYLPSGGVLHWAMLRMPR